MPIDRFERGESWAYISKPDTVGFGEKGILTLRIHELHGRLLWKE
jgi:hypothetical protein